MSQTQPAPHHIDPERLTREMNWNLLRTFVVLAESGSVTEAAEQLRLKQPTVSVALKKLEDQLGQRLIDRSPGHFALTEAGELLYREAVNINGSILRLATLMRTVAPEISGHVRIAVASHVLCPLFDSVIGDFYAEHPKASLAIDVITSGDAIAAVAAKRVSFALALVREPDPNLRYIPVYRETFALFCGPRHPLFGRSDLTLDDLKGHAAVVFDNDRLQDALQDVTLLRARAALATQVTGVSENLEEVRRMIMAGLGIGPLPKHVVARDLRDGLLWQVPPFEDLPEVDVYLVWNPDTVRNRAEEKLLNNLIARLETVPYKDRSYA
ncbi:LysR family transcriptional regulator [Epibacterium sp. DP7N7-1]|uniref:LysR family transcriptional regulator n=1 Tax=Tritonibacter mobilis F1926 TaxID=1265309 RepID=A0A1B0ZZY1_9RHOB|nr:LysR family transcriptional regulator [Tritonibacter mobilis]ANP39826.1 LysR family transcriptional regulator [Tritonibacter mobilis F1926]KJZ23994.1 LysR family transcriptional regulator [Tritonibacter mobilis]MBW3243784.1 LysR family transcriptional regulator [Epibacterium sp. DP7N7-1]MCZ4267188.1 LysR family transcriptional regulator [Rhodobacteraceae bacterium G21628-S1]